MFANKFVKFLLYTLVICVLTVSGKDFQDFEDLSDAPNVCYHGKRQSPINIAMKNVIRRQYEKDHLFKVLNHNHRANLSITHRSVEPNVKLNGSSHGRKHIISGSLLSNQTYVFSEAHIHKSHDDNSGTEHSIEGKRFAAELHCVHVNSKYANVSEAMHHSDGLAVIGILFKVDDNAPYNDEMQPVASLCQSFDEKRSTSIQPKLTSSFFHYNGSLTLPPCKQNVRWIVLTKPLPISSATMRLLRSVDTNVIESHPVRALQSINGRRIEMYERK